MATPNVPIRPGSRMSARPQSYYDRDQPVALRSEEARAGFITRTYLHLFGAIVAFTLLETAYFATGLALPIAMVLLSTSWLLVLGGFVLVSWIATRVAHATVSPGAQYAALGAYVVAESIIFVPFIVIKDDAILYEGYFNGYDRDSIVTSFSAAKSFTSALIGIAIDEGYIGSVDDLMVTYLPELKGKGFDDLTIRHLLTMSSGIQYRQDDEYPDLQEISQFTDDMA